jgi:hypothetical protein
MFFLEGNHAFPYYTEVTETNHVNGWTDDAEGFILLCTFAVPSGVCQWAQSNCCCTKTTQKKVFLHGLTPPSPPSIQYQMPSLSAHRKAGSDNYVINFASDKQSSLNNTSEGKQRGTKKWAAMGSPRAPSPHR